MHHFFVEPSQVHEDEIEILGGDVNHIRNVLRMKAGEELVINDGYGNEYGCRLHRFTDAAVCAKILEKRRVASELPSRITLYQCLPKGDKMELIIQKAVELGVYQVVPVVTKRCVVRLDEKKAQKKKERWQEISKSAAKQSGRGLIPEVTSVLSWREALSKAQELDVCLIPYELAEGMSETKEILASLKPGQSIGVFIGPEGGFEKAEILEALESGAKAVTLGRRILRTETAGITTLSVLMFQLEE